MNRKSINNDIRPVFSGHGTFPMRYGWLKKVYDACVNIRNKNGDISKDLFNNDEAIVILGVGKNMVASMRYWATNTGILSLKRGILSLTEFADELFADDGLDPWMENYATLWFLHWNLISLKKDCLYTYYWLFNHYTYPTFDKHTLAKRITEAVKDNGWSEMSADTLDRDIGCLISLYATKPSRNRFTEEKIESPLTELELISPITRRDVLQLNRGAKPNLSIYTFLFGLFKFWNYYSPNSKTLSFESICYAPMSPGKVFLINEDVVAGFMQDISNATDGILAYSETAGLKQLFLKKDVSYLDETAFCMLRKNYK